MTTSWSSLLETFEGRIRLGETALENNNAVDPSLLEPWAPPADIGPMPANCLDRALEILARYAALEQRFQASMNNISSEIRKTSQAHRHTSPFTDTQTPRYFDDQI